MGNSPELTLPIHSEARHELLRRGYHYALVVARGLVTDIPPATSQQSLLSGFVKSTLSSLSLEEESVISLAKIGDDITSCSCNNLPAGRQSWLSDDTNKRQFPEVQLTLRDGTILLLRLIGTSPTDVLQDRSPMVKRFVLSENRMRRLTTNSDDEFFSHCTVTAVNTGGSYKHSYGRRSVYFYIIDPDKSGLEMGQQIGPFFIDEGVDVAIK